MIGKTIFHYKILSKRGSGGMGLVYKAEDIKLKRTVVLKFLPKDLTRNATAKARFIQEAQAAAALNHPNICTIHEINETDDQIFIAMEYIKGQSLSEKIEWGRLSVDEALDFALQTCRGLQEAHRKGIVHRDIKSANIMVTEQGQVKILDFGLARLSGHSRITKAGSTLGTVAYMSFEQASGEEVDHRTDIWSLGVVLYEMVTGHLPFQGQVDQVVIYSILNKEPQPLTALRTEAPLELERIVNKVLAKDLDERYGAAAEVLADLENLKSMSEGGKAKASPAKLRPHRTRRFWYAGVAVPLILLIVSGLYLLKTQSEKIESIAVLPLENLSGDPEQDYFVEGMHEALLTNLSQIKALKVISRTSMARYKNSDKSAIQIADELGVDALIEGAVLRVEDHIRISTQLIDGETDEHLWAKNYDRELENVLLLISDVALGISREIKVVLTQQEEGRLAESRAINPAAYEAYLKGRYFFNQLDMRKSLDYFKEAIAIDPNFALAYGGLASTYAVLVFFGHDFPERLYPLAEKAAFKAIELNKDIGEAYAALGGVKLYGDWDWPAAEEKLITALELSPNNALIRHWYADYLMVTGDLEESVRQVKLGRQYDPMAPIAIAPVLGHLYLARRYDEVIAGAQKTLEEYPNLNFAHWMLREALWQSGRYNEALAEYQKIYGADQELSQILEKGDAESGPKEAIRMLAFARIRRLQAESDSPLQIARLYAKAEDADSTFVWLEKAFEERSPGILHLKADPRYDYLRPDPRFQDLLQRIGFPNSDNHKNS